MSRESTDDAFITGDIISISPRVEGYVDKVLINDNQFVREGDILVELDPKDFQVSLDMARESVCGTGGPDAKPGTSGYGNSRGGQDRKGL